MLEIVTIVGTLVGVAFALMARQLGRDQRRWFWGGAAAAVIAFMAALWHRRRKTCR
jgi:hypothetical protein